MGLQFYVLDITINSVGCGCERTRDNKLYKCELHEGQL